MTPDNMSNKQSKATDQVREHGAEFPGPAGVDRERLARSRYDVLVSAARKDHDRPRTDALPILSFPLASSRSIRGHFLDRMSASSVVSSVSFATSF
jgi:hypothetical protein